MKMNYTIDKMRYGIFIILEVVLLSFILTLLINPIEGNTSGGNATVTTTLSVGNVPPEIRNVSIFDGNTSFNLAPNTTTLLNCAAIIRDFNNESDISNVQAEIYYNNATVAYWGDGIFDNNTHYINYSCNISRNYTNNTLQVSDDIYHALANCTFRVQYYARPGDWNCTVTVNDSMNWNATGSDNITINELLAVQLPSIIDYGTVNATFVSLENMTNVTNVGNVKINLSLYGYGYNVTDNNAMNCTLGSIKNISIEHEKYNLTSSTAGALTLGQTATAYYNLTNASMVPVREFNLNYRQDDSVDDAINTTYWRIYVPIGVAGTCQGRVVIGATKSSAS
jgi:hypothetical protein